MNKLTSSRNSVEIALNKKVIEVDSSFGETIIDFDLPINKIKCKEIVTDYMENIEDYFEENGFIYHVIILDGIVEYFFNSELSIDENVKVIKNHLLASELFRKDETIENMIPDIVAFVMKEKRDWEQLQKEGGMNND